MARRIREEPSEVELDQATATQRARQLELRLRCSVPLEGNLWHKIRRETEAAKRLEPAERLEALLDLADRLRPSLPEDVQRYTLPAGITERDRYV